MNKCLLLLPILLSVAAGDTVLKTESITTEHYLLTLGGYCDDAVYMSRVRQDGSLEPWTTETSYPLVFGAQGLAAIGNRVYSAGGFICAEGTPTDSTFSAKVVDGKLGKWQAEPDLPLPVFTNSLLADESTLFSLGGWAPYADSVFKADLNAKGKLGSWTQLDGLPVPRDFAGAVRKGKHIWLVGGDESAMQPKTEVFMTTVTGKGLGEWKSSTPLPSPGRFGHGIVVHDNRMFVLGGANTTGPTKTVFFADINPEGELGSWTETTELPEARWFIGVETLNDRLYVIAGGGAEGATKTVWSAPFTKEGLGKFTAREALPGGLQDNRAVILTVAGK